MKTLKAIAFTLIAGATVVYAGDTVHYMNLFRNIDGKNNAHCQPVNGIAGPEDIVKASSGDLIISSDLRKDRYADYPSGTLFLLKAEDQKNPVPLWKSQAEDFHPHGIDMWTDKDGSEYLYVINHGKKDDSVLIFSYKDRKLSLLREVPFPGMTTLNDIAPVSQTSFYVTSDHATSSGMVNMLSDYLRLPAGSVIYFDGNRPVVEQKSITFANGIALSPDKTRVYVASTLDSAILVYKRDPVTNHLGSVNRIALDGSPDNISVEENGDLIVAVHPKIMALSAQRRSHENHAPSVIQQIQNPDGNQRRIDTIFSDPGMTQSSASVGSRLKQQLIIGSVFGDHLLLCGERHD